MKALTVTVKNGIDYGKVISLNPANIIKYFNTAAGLARIYYDSDSGGKNIPATLFVVDKTKAQLDALIAAEDEITLLYANVINPGTGAVVPTTFNSKYIASLRDTSLMVNGTLNENAVELVYCYDILGEKILHVEGPVSSITYVKPTFLKAKMYSALLTQNGTAAPVATVLEDTVTGLVWARTGVGTYTLTKAGAFTVGKAIPVKAEQYYDKDGNRFVLTPTSVNVYTLETYAAADDQTLADSVLSNQYLHLEIYS